MSVSPQGVGPGLGHNSGRRSLRTNPFIETLVNKQFANLDMAIEIVDLPIENGDFP